MKTQITRKLLAKEQGASWKSFFIAVSIILGLMLLLIVVNFKDTGLFFATCVFFVGIFVMIILLQTPNHWIPARSYLRLAEVEKKKFIDSPDKKDSETRYVLYCLRFRGEWLGVDKEVFDRSEEGEQFYVAYYAASKKAYACFEADLYEPGKFVRVKK